MTLPGACANRSGGLKSSDQFAPFSILANWIICPEKGDHYNPAAGR